MNILRVLPFALVISIPVYGETNETDDSVDMVEEVVVTGSRIRRDEYTSASPIQIIDGSKSRELGLIDTASLLQSATQATGYQVDNTFTAFVLDNGPGSAQVNLRGLGAERVLVLMNSKRLAPGGVGGAPTSPDISTIPNIMVDRIEYLLDGASSIYGSDAVSGVANVIMRTDFEGFEFEGQVSDPRQKGGGEDTLGIAWGASGDNWTFGIGAEYYDRERVRLMDRRFTAECDRYIYEDENGQIRNNYLGLAPGTTESPCRLGTINRVVLLSGHPLGNVWFTEGTSNIGVPNFSDTETNPGFNVFNPTIIPTDTNGDGVPDLGLIDPDGNGLTEIDLQSDAYNFNGSARERTGDLLLGSRRTNIYTYGEYDLQNKSNSTLYFEGLYASRDTEVFSTGAQIFPDVPASNPYNPCNQSSPFGANCWGFFGFNFGDVDTIPIVVVRGDREGSEVEIDQTRFVLGMKGDIPGWSNNSGFGNWGYDGYYSYSKSTGIQSSRGILEDNLLLSLNTSVINDAGEIVCGVDGNSDGNPDSKSCVPVNMFAPSLYQPGGGTFATDAETDFLFGVRSFETVVEQTVMSGVLQGDLWELPWNNTPVPLVAGMEYRVDKINSIPNSVASRGRFYAFFSDGGAVGKRDITELFVETELQLLEGQRAAEELSLNLALRWTDESTYGSDTTYSTKILYKPLNGITLRGTYGTSFRAPNAQEQFLIGQSGFVTVGDPCVVPIEARDDPINPADPSVYDPTKDQRAAQTIANCAANGVDPLTLGLEENINDVYSVETLRKGGQQVQLTIKPETSVSRTFGIILDQPFTDAFELRFGATYYDIDVSDSISLLSSGFVINDCYVEKPNNTSAFCGFIRRDEDGLIEFVDSSFININQISSSGVDYNLFYGQDFVVADRNLGIEVDVRMTRISRNLFRFQNAQEDDAGTPAAPEWEGNLIATATYGDFGFNWRAAYIGGEQDDAVLDYGVAPPCQGLSVQCRPVSRTSYYWNHSASLTWEPRDWQFTLGLVNIFDEEPPLLDNDSPELQLNNVPLGRGYDMLGRRMFASVRKEF